jgi:spore germination cell wall hydrolase CwlJ-like protein
MSDELDLVFTALTAWREAQGEPTEGQRAVIHVLLNRTADSRWPDTSYEVCVQPQQFSCYNAGDPCAAKWPVRGSEPWETILKMARDPGNDPTAGANHYHTDAVQPYWADPNKITAIIGNHIFYKL